MAIDSASSNPFVKPANAPGAQKPSGRSMLGKQADSRKATAPTFSFSNSTDRETASKMFLSAGHINVENKCREGPGAVYKVPGALGPQVQTSKITAPSFSLNTKAERLKSPTKDTPGPGTYTPVGSLGQQPESLKTTGPRYSMSPMRREQREKMFLTAEHIDHELKGTQGAEAGSYKTPGALGLQPLSTKRSGPSFSWGSEEKLHSLESAKKNLPPVGKYETWHAIGKQPLSNFKTLPSYGFGRGSSWEQEEKRFLSLGHTRTLQGGASPSNYEHQTEKTMTTFGKQVLSNKSYSGGSKFGTEPKNLFKTSNTPGPGSYD